MIRSSWHFAWRYLSGYEKKEVNFMQEKKTQRRKTSLKVKASHPTDGGWGFAVGLVFPEELTGPTLSTCHR